MKLIILSLLTFGSLMGSGAHADDQALEPPFHHFERTDQTRWEKAENFGIVYAAQWAMYFVTASDIIRENGSWHNWLNNPSQPHFDFDSYDFNVFRHSIVGHYYYLFYRSRGYTEKESFLWAFVSSTAFEFTIETATERPSFQDVYQTPVYGSLLGMGMERLSKYLHNKDGWAFHVLGYVFNPFSIYPGSAFHYALLPNPKTHAVQAQVTWEF